jgi:DNA-binding beta-propeller fold protein YncE
MSTRLSTTFAGLHNPTAICFGANKLFVLDQGDTAAARTNLECLYAADCGPLAGFSRPIADVSKYWAVHEYELDGAPIGTFTDTTFAWVNGIAADAERRVYVSGIVIYCKVDVFDTRIRTLTSRFRIQRYVPGATADGVIGAWHRDPTWQVGEGTGIGFALDPRGMQWSDAGGAALYFADRGGNEVQKFGDPASYATSFKLDIDLNTTGTAYDADSIVFQQPLDVAVDGSGYIYCLDAGNRRVLRYAPDQAFVQRVDIEPTRSSLVTPVAVSADTDQVYVADRGLNQVVRYRRRK